MSIEAVAPRAMSTKDWGLLILLGAIWGGSFFFARIAVAEMHPLALVLFRVCIAATALHLYLAAVGLSFAVARPHLGPLILMGIFNNAIPFSLIFAGQTELGAGVASVLNATTPFWTILVANAFTSDEKITWNKITGILCGIAGTAVMIGPGIVAGLGGPVWAKVALIAASISYAVALMVARRLRALPSAVVAAGQLTVSTIVMLPTVLMVRGTDGLFQLSPHVWAAVLAMALVSTALAYIIFFRLVARVGATNASLVTLIVPVSAILLGVLFLGETLELFEIAGMALVAVGLLVIDGRILRRR